MDSLIGITRTIQRWELDMIATVNEYKLEEERGFPHQWTETVHFTIWLFGKKPLECRCYNTDNGNIGIGCSIFVVNCAYSNLHLKMMADKIIDNGGLEEYLPDEWNVWEKIEFIKDIFENCLPRNSFPIPDNC